MVASGLQHQIRRTYRAGAPLQWARETYTNAVEAGASRVSFGVEWQAVAQQDVYRRVIADDGQGMSPEELVQFFNHYGGGGKPIGGDHENFGVGAKSSLLPWNPYGVVVVSWQGGEGSMIWVQRDHDSGEYGLRLFHAVDPETGEAEIVEAVAPFSDPEHGCDWAAVGPEWCHDHGTVIVLLGDGPQADTILGDPDRGEAKIRGIASYLNRRLWVVPESLEVRASEVNHTDKKRWPRTPEGSEMNNRRVRGARHYIDYESASVRGALEAHGERVLSDGTQVEWYLWSGDRPAVQSYASVGGFVGALYNNELYNVSAERGLFARFGIAPKEVRDRTWLIVKPPPSDPATGYGVYPRTDRNALLIGDGEELPMSDWADEFSEILPEELFEAVRSAYQGQEGTLQDSDYRERLKTKFGDLWRAARYVPAPGGTTTTTLTLSEDRGGKTSRTKRQGGSDREPPAAGLVEGERRIGLTPSGPIRASRVSRKGELPHYRLVTGYEDGILAEWVPNDPMHPAGAVHIYADHPVLIAAVRRWQERYSPADAEVVEREVLAVYGEVAVTKVAHSEQLRSLVPSNVIDDEFRSGPALTMSLLGLYAEDSLIARRLSGKVVRSRRAA